MREAIKSKPCGETYRFYACGGDGTLCEVVSGAADETLGGAVPGVQVGVIPVGTGNDFVRNFSNREFFLDITKQILGDGTEIDCYSLGGGKYGVNMINIGFDCEVVVRVARYKKKRFVPKKLAYILGVAAELIGNRGKHIRVVKANGEVIEKDFQLVSAANGGFCGGGFNSAPRSSLSDGLIDISLIDKVNRRTFLGLVGAYKKGTHLDTKLGKRVVNYGQAKAVRFEFEEPTNVCIDGEVDTVTNLSVTAVKNGINFIIPVGCGINCNNK